MVHRPKINIHGLHIPVEIDRLGEAVVNEATESANKEHDELLNMKKEFFIPSGTVPTGPFMSPAKKKPGKWEWAAYCNGTHLWWPKPVLKHYGWTIDKNGVVKKLPKKKKKINLEDVFMNQDWTAPKVGYYDDTAPF